ncbi:bifunctional diaminohydroxyphosphoribosylaminopyrimidine deaminase/5-amino-6-(5-phosphoribosylamino)uracil reductase RibD [Stappia albiluteola]|nr:bifunctional diaminohydroxyphosphoribosylaminopyrimidine deaminase/5-amino-6-(5-phosphoribosylamino)uracil reductase RibD [Stappia albiluteola]
MAAALSLARRASGRVWPNPAVGALIVDESGDLPVIRGRGWTSPPGGPHAEAVALRNAGDAARGATCYVTLEPCSHQGRTGACSIALIEAGISRVVVALADPNPRVSGRGIAMLRDAGVEVVTGVCEDEARRHHAGFVMRMRHNRPQVLLKLAISQDGFIGRRNGGQVLITGEDVARRVHLFRAECDAICVGIGTVLSDDPELTCRLPGMSHLSPVRVVLDARADLPMNSYLARTAGEVPVWLIVSNAADYEKTDALAARGVTVIRVPQDEAGRIAPHVALRVLGQRGITRLLLEGGSRVAESFVAAGAVDEVMAYHGTATVGEGGVKPLGDHGLELLDEKGFVRLPGRRRVGGESFEYLRREEG